MFIEIESYPSMNSSQHNDFLNLLKGIGDKQRLQILSMTSQREYKVGELAELLDLSEPTTSYHLSKLHGLGLLRLRMDANQHFYSLNEKRLAQFKQYAAELEQPIVEAEVIHSDNQWIEALEMSKADKKVLLAYTENQRISQFPMKESKWLVILRWLASQFEAERHYSEKEVNALLGQFHEDYATLRRNLVEYGFMRRERGGGDYWLSPE